MRPRTAASALARLTTVAGLTCLVAGAAVTASPATAEDVDPATAVSARAAGTTTRTLHAGQALVARTDHSMLSNGWYSLEMSSGMVSLVETIPVAPDQGMTSSAVMTWFRNDATGAFQAQHDRTRLRLTREGDLALVTSQGRRLWHSGTAGSGAVRLTLHRGGNLALHTESGKVVWSTRSGQVQLSGGMTLQPGEQLRDASETGHPGGRIITLTMQRNGNLVHRCGSRVDWQTRTSVPGSTLRMYRNGALRVIGPKGRIVWGSGSGGDHAYAYLNSNDMVITGEGLEMLWYARLDSQGC